MATDFISREAVKNAIHRDLDMQDLYLPIEFIELLDDIPAADVRPVVRARWKWIAESACHVCSNCGAIMRYNPEKGFFIFHTLPNFCHNCGADMRPEPPEEEKDG